MDRVCTVSFIVLAACSSSSTSPAAANPAEAAGAASAVDPTPDAFHSVTPILVLPDVQAGLDWYTKAFGATTALALAMPDGKIGHAEIELGGSRIMLVGASPAGKPPAELGGTNGGIQLYVEDVDAIAKSATEAGAKTTMPVADMFWGDRFTQIVDPFGHVWSVSTHKEDVAPEVLEARSKAFGEAVAANKEPPMVKLSGDSASWKPKGMHEVNPVLWIDGGAESLGFYEKALGAEIVETVLMPDGKTLMHAEIRVGDTLVMVGSTHPEAKLNTPKALGGASVRFYVFVDSVDEAFDRAVSAGATAQTPVADMPWGDRWGVVTDPSGYAWGLATHIEDVDPAEVERRIKASMAAGQD